MDGQDAYDLLTRKDAEGNLAETVRTVIDSGRYLRDTVRHPLGNIMCRSLD